MLASLNVRGFCRVNFEGIVQNLDWTGQLDWTVGLDNWTGQLDWTIGLDSWTGQLDWTVGLDNWTGQLDWTIGLDSWTGQLDWTVRLDYWTGFRMGFFPLNRRNLSDFKVYEMFLRKTK